MARPNALGGEHGSPARLGDLTRIAVKARAAAGAACLLPVGSLEQHGEHLPIATDSRLAEAICLRAAELSKSDILVAPVIWTGFSPHHFPFGATVTVSQETVLALVREVAQGLLSSFTTVVIVNGHGGNRGLLSSLTLELGVLALDYWELASDTARDLFRTDGGSIGHAGQVETSLMLATEPKLVGQPGENFEPCIFGDDLLYNPGLGSSGVIGDARAASHELGLQFFEACAHELALRIDNIAALPELRIKV